MADAPVLAVDGLASSRVVFEEACPAQFGDGFFGKETNLVTTNKLTSACFWNYPNYPALASALESYVLRLRQVTFHNSLHARTPCSE